MQSSEPAVRNLFPYRRQSRKNNCRETLAILKLAQAQHKSRESGKYSIFFHISNFEQHIEHIETLVQIQAIIFKMM